MTQSINLISLSFRAREMDKARECGSATKQKTCGNTTCVKWTKVFLVLLIALMFLTVVILSLIPNSPLLAAIFQVVSWVEGLPTIPSMVILIEVYTLFHSMIFLYEY